MSWEKIDEHRRNARNTKLDILIWGSSESDPELYKIRREIQNYLQEQGHSAKFSEELVNEGKVKTSPDNLIDEFFHADSADLIILLYKSRGTQTELERILKYGKFAKKCFVFMELEMWNILQSTLLKIQLKIQQSRIISIDNFNTKVIIEMLNTLIENKQFEEYLKKLEINLLLNE